MLKTALDDASTLTSAHEDSERTDLRDGESLASTEIDDTEFDFDFEVINTAASRKVFNTAGRKLTPSQRGETQEPKSSTPDKADISQTEALLPFHSPQSMTESPDDEEYKFTFSAPNDLSWNFRSEQTSPNVLA
jgi:hypothetical protein